MNLLHSSFRMDSNSNLLEKDSHSLRRSPPPPARAPSLPPAVAFAKNARDSKSSSERGLVCSGGPGPSAPSRPCPVRVRPLASFLPRPWREEQVKLAVSKLIKFGGEEGGFHCSVLTSDDDTILGKRGFQSKWDIKKALYYT